jgi:hypothetical protein
MRATLSNRAERDAGSILLLFLFCFTPVLDAADYYVSGSTGHDSNPGSAALPWQTLQSHVASLLPGDTLNILAGTYSGFIVGWDPDGTYGVLSGTDTQPVTIQAAPGTDGTNVVITTKNNKTQYAIDVEPGCGFIVLSKLTIDGSSGGFAQYPNRGGGIKVAASPGCRIEDCRIQNVDYGFGILADNVTNLLVGGNTIRNTGAHGNGDYGHGLYLSGSTALAVVDGNLIYSNDYIGIHINGDLSEGGLGLVTACNILNNRIFSNGQNAINADGLQGSIIENNVIFNYQDFGICLYRIDAADGGKNNLIVNNTICNGTNTATGAALRFLDASTGNTVFNNVLLSSVGDAYRISGDSLPGLASDFNVMDVGTRIQSDDDGSEQSFAQWQMAGHDAHSLMSVQDALFANYQALDFHPLDSAPAVAAGVASLEGYGAPAFDCSWASRPHGGGWDIGAYQSGSPAGSAASQILTGIDSNSDSSRTLYGVGIPFCTYLVQATSTLEGPTSWQTIGAVTAGPTGSWQFLDTDVPKGPSRFYRTMFP